MEWAGEFVTSDMFYMVGATVIATGLTILNAFIKEYVGKWRALKELNANPFCTVGAILHEFQDAAGRQLMKECRISDIDLGVVTLEAVEPDTEGVKRILILTCQEYKAGYAFYRQSPALPPYQGAVTSQELIARTEGAADAVDLHPNRLA